VWCGDLLSVEISDGAVIPCSFELCGKVVNKSNIEFNIPSIGTHTRNLHLSLCLFAVSYRGPNTYGSHDWWNYSNYCGKDSWRNS
jgi:hypothetical protein